MASVAQEPRAGTPDPVGHPLAKLSARIRGYVVAEGLLVAVILAAVWAWLDLAFDYGCFRLFTLDWVQVPGSWVARLLILGVVGLLLATYLVLRVIVRSVVHFSPKSLALVLERRHPELLGDRLITAVELADVAEAERLGYSPQMVRMTIAEGAKRAEQIQVGAVLRWSRLVWLGVVAGIVTLGVYATVITTTAIVNARSKVDGPVGKSFAQFGNVSSLWFKRNVMLLNRIWPRQAFIELVGFDPSGRLKVATDAPPPRIQAQAYKWVLEDPTTAEGYRPMVWGDLARNPKWLATAVPTLPLEDIRTVARETAGVELAAAESANWSLDRVQAVLVRDEFRTRFMNREKGEEVIQQIDKVFDDLVARAGDPNAAVPFRMLTVPETAVVATWGLNTSNRLPLSVGPDNTYAGTLADLKESVWFNVRGLDYSTAPKQIVLVPPPRLASMTRAEKRPAYLYHRPPLVEGPGGDTARDEALRKLKQVLPEEGVSLSGPLSEIEVPFGTDVHLKATADKKLVSARLVPRPPKPIEGLPPVPAAPPVDLVIEKDGFTIVADFPDVRSIIDADVEFTDEDRIIGKRRILVKPSEDRVPVVDVTVPVLRKTAEGIKITKDAYIPFDGVVTDATGLTRIEFESKYTELDAPETQARGVADAVGLIYHFFPEGNPVGPLAGRFYLPAAAGMLQGNTESEASLVEVPQFRSYLAEKAARDVVVAGLEKVLSDPPPAESRLVKRYEFKPELDPIDLTARTDKEPDRIASFDLKKYVLWPRSKDPSLAALKRYKLQVAVVATDNNLLTGPRSARNKETLNFIVVPESELLNEINKDSETQTFKMRRDLVDPMLDARLRLAKAFELVAAIKEKDQLASQAVRVADVLETVNKGSGVATEIYNDYRRIIQEQRCNRVTREVYQRVEDNIYFPLGDVLPKFPATEDALRVVKDELDAGRSPSKEAADRATQRLTELVDELEAILKQMDEQVNYEKIVAAAASIKFGVDGIGKLLDTEWQNAQLKQLKQLADVDFKKLEPVTVEASKKAMIKVEWERVDWAWPIKLRFRGPAAGELKLPSEIVTTADATEATFEVTAAAKAGEYMVEVYNAEKPANKVQLKVTVK